MSLYERKLEKLEALAGLHECSHPNALTYQSPEWSTIDGQPPFRQTTCSDCGTLLERSPEAGPVNKQEEDRVDQDS